MPNFPTSLDTLTNPSATDYLNSPSHAGQHANANDILEALEAKVGITGVGFNPASSSASASLDLHEDTDNGTNKVTVIAPASIASDKTLTLPDATGTVAITSDIPVKATASETVAGTDDAKFLTALSSVSHMNYGMARQAIMNGNFDVWQRGTSVDLVDVTTQFKADRWLDYVLKDGGTLPTLTRSQQIQTPGDIQGSEWYSRLATNGAGTSLGVNSFGEYVERIEHGVSKLCGLNNKVTVSFWARSSIANKRICPTLRQNYGTGGSPTAEELILGTPITLTSTWTKYTATFTTNTLVGKTFGNNTADFLELDLYYMWGTTYGNIHVQASVTAETFVGAGNIDIAQVQLCSGDVALPFQPKSFEEELRACQRFYEVGSYQTIGYGLAGNISGGNVCNYKVLKRISPTLTLTNAYNANCGTTTTKDVQNANCFSGYRTATGTATINFQDTWTAEAEL